MAKDSRMEKVLEKVKKLVALSKSSNEHEAALALERAQALLAEYNLSIADIEKDESNPDFIISRSPVQDSMPYRRQVGHNISLLYFCTYFYEAVPAMSKRGNVYTRDRHCIVGAQHNVVVAQMMFDYLVKAIDRLAREGAAEVGKEAYWSFQTAFKVACTSRLCARIKERIAQARAGTTPTTNKSGGLPALADLYDRTQADIKAFLDKLMGDDLKELNPRGGKYDLEGAMAGMIAGDSIGLDTQLTGTKAGAHLLGRR